MALLRVWKSARSPDAIRAGMYAISSDDHSDLVLLYDGEITTQANGQQVCALREDGTTTI